MARSRVFGSSVVAHRPRPELLRVAYGPDVSDPVVCDVERVHGHDDAVLLGDQAGLTVDGALQERQVGQPAGESDEAARELLGALERAVVARPPPSPVAVTAGSRRPMRAPMSLASQACELFAKAAALYDDEEIWTLTTAIGQFCLFVPIALIGKPIPGRPIGKNYNK